MLLYASLKRRPSVASQAPVGQRTLTCIKTDNLEKNKRKKKKERFFIQIKILMVTLYNFQKAYRQTLERESEKMYIHTLGMDREDTSWRELSCLES